MGKHGKTSSGLGGFMNGASIRFSGAKNGSGGADAWRDSLMQASKAMNNAGRAHSVGTELPEKNTIHKGVIISVKEYGAFVQIGEGLQFKDGLIHITGMGDRDTIDRVEDIVREGQLVWVKVNEVDPANGKYGLDLRYVDQRDGKDLDPLHKRPKKLPNNYIEVNQRRGATTVVSEKQEVKQSSVLLQLSQAASALRQSLEPQSQQKRAAPAAETAAAAPPKKKKKKMKKDGSSDISISLDSSDSSASEEVDESNLAEARKKAQEKLEKARKKLEKMKKKAEKSKKKKDKKKGKDKKKDKKKKQESDSESGS
eukprot:TRINITY_DN41251_c0_g1_i2.p1 TRINITY_DN41251_c0_g1~~TRINITY_DN41251_c0_g1_i2.p1  ORF type:complete len:340 (-),score=124.50 TRINITY_DN41251_c0_g1_i2:344-1279(-)